jgi:hypothetical protein
MTDGIARIGKTINHAIDKFIGVILETRKGYNQTVFVFNPSGDDSVPCKNDKVIILKVDGTGNFIGAGVLTESQGAKPGEKIFFGRDADGKITSKLSMLNSGNVETEADGDISVKNKGNQEYITDGDLNVEATGKMSMTITGDITIKKKKKIDYESDDINFISTEPIGLNDGLYKAGLQPYFSSENGALTALQTSAAAAAAQLSVLDGLSGGAGTIAAFGAAIVAFCSAMISADSAADANISQVVK